MTGEPWFSRWFGEEYLRLYPHRDMGEARDAVALLTGRVRFSGPVLDLACGAGRHLRAFHDRGVSPIGLDLSPHLLERAKKRVPEASLVRGDMRHLPFPGEAFTVVSSFFTSFGYFEREGDDRRVLREIARVLRPGGHLFLDFLNAPKVRADLVPRDRRVVDGREVVQTRRLVDEGRRVEKTIRIDRDRTFTERVRLYDARELEALLVDAGLEPLERLGDYRGAPHTPDSPRTILLARH
jgi:SAM-dependent methyltransferase